MAPRIAPTTWAGAAAVLIGAGLIGSVSARAAVMGAAKALPYAEAVGRTQAAAEAVLAGEARETCLRGKLTNALIGLSSSCEASGQRSPLCQLADSAAVVTPMSLNFMKDTATKLLELIAAPGGPSASAKP
jgi:hypothetical protein